MSVVEKVIALIGGMSAAEVRALPPLKRQLLAMACRRVADVADPPAERFQRPTPAPRSGVLAALHMGERARQ